MSKKLSKSGKKANKNLISIVSPRILFLSVFTVIIFVVGFYFLEGKTNQDVKGDSDSTISTVDQTLEEDNGKFVISINTFNDNDKNGKWNKKSYGTKGEEQCLTGSFVVSADNVEYTAVTSRPKNNKWCNPGIIKIDLGKGRDPFKCVDLVFKGKKDGSWVATGITYFDGEKLIIKKGKAKAKICPMGILESSVYAAADFGLHKK